ncbi:MAG: hypothetical protein Q4C81_04380 [Kocuria sp.]|nr:hypothetical protein [Kocuria sp.]
MPLKHIPAHTTSHPDRFEDEETGWGYSVQQDLDAEDPRTWTDDEHASVHTYRGPRGHADVVPENLAAQAFDRYWQDHDAEQALALTERYLAAFHPEERISVAVRTVRGSSQDEWRDVFAAVADGHGTPDGHIDQFRMWAFGDVWTVVPDKGSGISGIYADSPEAALEQFRKDFEDETVGDDPSVEVGWDNELPKAIAECLADREEPEAARAAAWLKEHESDDQVWSAINRLFDDLQELAAA